MKKYLLFLLSLIVFSCYHNTDNKIINNQTKQSLSIKKKEDTVYIKKNKTDFEKENIIADSCLVKGKIKFEHHTFGKPYRKGDPSFKDLVKKASSRNSFYKIEIYLKGKNIYTTVKLQKTIIVDYKHNFHYEFKLKKHQEYMGKIYYKNLNYVNKFIELKGINARIDNLIINDEDIKEWDMYRSIFTT